MLVVATPVRSRRHTIVAWEVLSVARPGLETHQTRSFTDSRAGRDNRLRVTAGLPSDRGGLDDAAKAAQFSITEAPYGTFEQIHGTCATYCTMHTTAVAGLSLRRSRYHPVQHSFSRGYVCMPRTTVVVRVETPAARAVHTSHQPHEALEILAS